MKRRQKIRKKIKFHTMNYNRLIKSKILAWNSQFHKISSSRWIFITEFYICVCHCVGNGGFILKTNYDFKCFVECINWQFTFDWCIVMNKSCTFKSITNIFKRMNVKLSLFHFWIEIWLQFNVLNRIFWRGNEPQDWLTSPLQGILHLGSLIG